MPVTLKYLCLAFISMVPVIELRGAVPLGLSWGLPTIPVFVVSVIFNMLPVPILVRFTKAVLIWGEQLPYVGFIFTFFLNLGRKKANKITGALMLGLYAFVAIPLPGTGAWTGSLIAAILDIPAKKAVIPITFGVLTAGIIMLVGTLGILTLV